MKAVGEPPLFLASSVFFAIKEAITAARIERGLNGAFRLDSPATAARIRMACEDEITDKVNICFNTLSIWCLDPHQWLLDNFFNNDIL